LELGLIIAMKRSALHPFEWSQQEDSYLSILSFGKGQGGTLIDKRFKHNCYMFESFYAVALRKEDNITQNPGCEWQLGL
jgi:hypothetical protein